ncbi:hypothetical protein DVDV_3027 [Desulfovibrio sp. DV]|nr:hypothetical protein DVDV_3027 [Desulfovibrio sp. DV]
MRSGCGQPALAGGARAPLWLSRPPGSRPLGSPPSNKFVVSTAVFGSDPSFCGDRS